MGEAASLGCGHWSDDFEDFSKPIQTAASNTLVTFARVVAPLPPTLWLYTRNGQGCDGGHEDVSAARIIRVREVEGSESTGVCVSTSARDMLRVYVGDEVSQRSSDINTRR